MNCGFASMQRPRHPYLRSSSTELLPQTGLLAARSMKNLAPSSMCGTSVRITHTSCFFWLQPFALDRQASHEIGAAAAGVAQRRTRKIMRPGHHTQKAGLWPSVCGLPEALLNPAGAGSGSNGRARGPVMRG